MANHYSNFFDPLLDTLEGKYQFQVFRKTKAGSGYFFDTRHDQYVKYEIRLAQGKLARVALNFDNKDRKRNIELVEELRQTREEIEGEIGCSLNWDQQKETRRRRIEITRPGSIDDDADTLAEIQDWMVENLLKFRQVFAPHLKELASQ